MAQGRVRIWVALAVTALALAACDPGGVRVSPTPAARPALPAPPAPVEPSAESRALSDYYSRVQQNLVAQGLLRTDGGWRISKRTLTILWSEGNPDVRWVR